MQTKNIRLRMIDSIALVVYYLLYNPVLQIAVTRALS
jgi:hypothetical protein